MWLTSRVKYQILLKVLGLSLVLWVLLLYNPGNIMTIEHCVMPVTVLCSGNAVEPMLADSLKMLLELNPFSMQWIGWGLMVVAMMLPKLTAPIQHIYARSFRRYRFIFVATFVMSYLSVWMIAGVLMIVVILCFQLWMPQSVYPAIGIGILAMIYQCSPLKQYSLNKGHDHRSLLAFGWPAFRAVTAFGQHHGIWCVGAGWALMLLPMLLPDWHNVAMIIVTFMMISEHMEHPQPVKWGINPRVILLHYIVAEMSIGWWRGWKIMKTKLGQRRAKVEKYRVSEWVN